MVLDTENTKNRKSTTKLRMHGRDAARKLTLTVDILQVFTIDFSEIQFIVNHNSQSDGQDKSAKRSTNAQKKTIRIIFLQRSLENTKDNGIELLSLSKTVSTASQANKLRNPFVQNNAGDGILLQAVRGGTSLNGIGRELMRFCKVTFVAVGFVYGRWRSTETDGSVDRYTSHVILLMQVARFVSCISHCMAQVSVCARHSIFMSSMMSV